MYDLLRGAGADCGDRAASMHKMYCQAAFRVMPVERIVILSASIPNVRIRCLSL